MTPPSFSEPPAELVLSVVMPVHNEIATIDDIVAAVRAIDIEKEIIIVDDCSTDGTRERLEELARCDRTIHLLHHERNQGKGRALRTGFAAARGRFAIIQDADLEYDPGEYRKLLSPLLEDRADVVIGSRFLGGQRHRAMYDWQRVGNKFLTYLSNKLTKLKLTDIETCYKAFRTEIIQRISIEEKGFGVEPEIVAKLAAYRLDGKPLRFCEVGISYHGRTYEEGKKIGWMDGLRALWCIAKYNVLR